MVFDSTINLGHILSTIAFISTGYYFIWGIQTKLLLLIQQTNTRHEHNTKELIDIKVELGDLSRAAIELAKQEVRMNNFDQRLLELSNRIHSHLVENNKKRSPKATV